MIKYLNFILLAVVIIAIAGINIYHHRPKFTKTECVEIKNDMLELLELRRSDSISEEDYLREMILRRWIIKEECNKHDLPWGFLYK